MNPTLAYFEASERAEHAAASVKRLKAENDRLRRQVAYWKGRARLRDGDNT
jgi:hypothetical protein